MNDPRPTQSRAYLRWTRLCLLIVALIVIFQNCSNTTLLLSSSTPSGSANGPSSNPNMTGGTSGGTDGMRYDKLGTCASGLIGMEKEIVVAVDGSRASLTVDSCQKLAAAQTLSMSDLSFAVGQKSVLQFKGQAFDLVTASSTQQTTVAVCSGVDPLGTAHSVTASVSASNPNVFYGRITSAQGADSGSMILSNPSAGTYVSKSNPAGSLNMKVNSPAAVAFSIGSGPSVSLSALNCSLQSAPQATKTALKLVSWQTSAWSPCSSGTQSRTMTCTDDVSALPLPAASCAAISPPVTSRTCSAPVQGSITVAAGASVTWTVPANVTQIEIIAIGGGGGGTALQAQSQGAGSGAIELTISVSAGDSFSIISGTGAAAGTNAAGGNSCVRNIASGALACGNGGQSGAAAAPGKKALGGTVTNTFGGGIVITYTNVDADALGTGKGGGAPDFKFPLFGFGGDLNASGADGIVVINYQ